ncbi:MAG: glycosyl transferase family 36 [Candidatus Omnitrophica bacterium]|nr:glycosyl transferase family 36 [Candidatus Omnitrophota bacterium]
MVAQKEIKKFRNKYGYFTEDGSEYVITNPRTPRPWINVNCNERYGYVVSQTGGGFSWYGNSQLSRLNIWHQDLIRDDYGKYIYVRDNKSKKIWSTTWKPTCVDTNYYEARYGLGYTNFTTVYNGVKTEQLMFVPRKDNCEVWVVKITNLTKQQKDLSFFTFLELCLGNGMDTHREFQKTFIETRIDKNLGAIMGYKRPALVPGFISTGAKDFPLSAFLSLVNRKADAYDGDMETFVGMYGSLKNPKAVVEGRLRPNRNIEKWGDPCFSLQADVKLNAHQTKELVFVLGEMGKQNNATRIIKKYRTKGLVEKELEKVIDFWKHITENSWIDTPDEAMNFLTNKWYRYQAISARMWAKTAYYQCSGGIGFRDQLQDSNCLLESDPRLTRKQILTHAEQQFPDGTVYHWWHPGTGIGAHTEMTDDLLWLAFLSLNYVDETGNTSLFNEKVFFTGKKKEAGTIYDHCCRAIDKVLSRWSKRGLPLIGEGDWNDGMSHVGLNWKGESIWLGHFLYGILTRFNGICEFKKDKKRAQRYRDRARKLKVAINKHGWDGKWYIRATRDNGKPLGSKKERRGKIFLNAQTWAIINGTATPERARIAMKSAYKYLFGKYGPLLFTPGYDKLDPTIGYLSRYAPSVRENGGVYTHAACWGVQAAAIMGDGERAYSAYKKMCPIDRAQQPDTYYGEPYVTPGNVDGPDSEKFGRGGWTWYSGSGAWMQKVAYNWICGIRATREGLVIDPCIPRKWKSFKAKRFYRGSTYYIIVNNPRGVNRGVKKIYLDNKLLSKNIIPPPKKKKSYAVTVIMGK